MLQYVSATTESVHVTNPNPLKLSFSVEVWDNILTYTLNPSWVIITLWQICHPYTNACRQFITHCASTFNCRLWCNLRTGEHIKRLECIIYSNILHLFSVLFIVSCWYNTVFVYKVPFFPRSYCIITVCSTLHQPACVSNIVKQL